MAITPIKIRRMAVPLETYEAAKKINIAQSTLYKIEQGYRSPSAKMIARIAKVYNCTIDEIYKDLNIVG